MTIKFSDITGGGIPYGNNAGRPANPGIGKLYSNGEAQRLELYTSNQSWENIIQEVPGVSSIGGAYLESNASNTITIYGTNFVSGATAYAIGTNGTQIAATSTTYNSLVQLTAVFTNLTSTYEPYDIKVVNPSNLFGILPDALYINNILTWQTNAGSLGVFQDNVSMSVSAIAQDDSTITYSLASGSSLPSGITLNSSTGLISGNIGDILQNVTYTFTINASDGSNPPVPRTFSMTFNAAPIWSTSSGSLGTFNHESTVNISLAATDVSDNITFSLASGQSLPSGLSLNSSTGVISGTLPTIVSDTTYNFIIDVTDGVNIISRAFSILSRYSINVEALVVAGGGAGSGFGGGGGGAGGLFYSSSYGLNTGSYTVTVGAGGSQNGNTTGSNGANSILGSITAIGGGASGWDGLQNGVSGGSGGGAGTSAASNNSGGSALQPSSASGGFGYKGGDTNDLNLGAGGGGAGGEGQSGPAGGAGGIGKQYSITGTATYYAGGGGGGARSNAGRGQTSGGLGGGGTGSSSSSNNGTAGTPNTGGGGGGSQGYPAGTGAGGNAGGSGVVIIAYPNTKPALTISGGVTYDQPTRAGYRVYRFTAGTGTITI